MSGLLVSDLHLTDNPRDEYRWDIFNQIFDVISDYEVNQVYILGDLTDKKDNHSAKLVSRIVENLLDMKAIKPISFIAIVKGNHDYTDKDNPFFEFLESISGIRYTKNPEYMGEGLTLLPHTKNPIWDWQDLDRFFFEDTTEIFMHQTVKGSLASNGMEMDGIPIEFFNRFKKLTHIFSGDIHVPQNVGNVTYVGAPYHINFGDKYDPRMIVVRSVGGGRITWESIPTKFPRKMRIDIEHPSELLSHTFNKDMIKVVLNLKRSDLVHWNEYRQEIHNICANKPVELCGITLQEQGSGSEQKKIQVQAIDSKRIFDQFCEKENISGELKKYGKEQLDENKGSKL
ncbi:hypothetical protein CL634_09420 [bacterium]|nr:hypothetical protein [bacterium]